MFVNGFETATQFPPPSTDPAAQQQAHDGVITTLALYEEGGGPFPPFGRQVKTASAQQVVQFADGILANFGGAAADGALQRNELNAYLHITEAWKSIFSFYRNWAPQSIHQRLDDWLKFFDEQIKTSKFMQDPNFAPLAVASASVPQFVADDPNSISALDVSTAANKFGQPETLTQREVEAFRPGVTEPIFTTQATFETGGDWGTWF